MKTKLIMLILALASLACLQTTIPAVTMVPTATTPPSNLTPDNYGAFAHPASSTSSHLTPETWHRTPDISCGLITALKAVNLREKPTEHSRVLYWLPALTQVTVLERDDWWKVTFENYTGFVKADFIRECDP